MGELLSAGMYRLLRSKVFYVCLAAMFLLEIFFLQGAAGDRTYWNEGLESSYFLYTLLLPLATAAFCGLFFGAEYSSGTLRNKFAAGHGKIKVYLSNTLLSMLAALCFIAAGALGGLLFQVISGEEFHLETVELVQAFACSLGVGIASASLCTLLAMLISSRSIGVVISLLAAVCTLYFAPFVNTCLEQPETIPQIKKTETVIDGMTVYGGEIDESLPEIPNPDYPSPAVKAVYEFLWDSVPACQGYRLTNEFRNGFKEESEPYDMLAGAAVLTLISTAAGLAIFQRKDVK